MSRTLSDSSKYPRRVHPGPRHNFADEIRRRWAQADKSAVDSITMHREVRDGDHFCHGRIKGVMLGLSGRIFLQDTGSVRTTFWACFFIGCVVLAAGCGRPAETAGAPTASSPRTTFSYEK